MAKEKNTPNSSSEIKKEKPTFLKKDLKDLSPKELQEALAHFKQAYDGLYYEYNLAIDEFSSYAEDLKAGLPYYKEKIEEINALLTGVCHTAVEESAG